MSAAWRSGSGGVVSRFLRAPRASTRGRLAQVFDAWASWQKQAGVRRARKGAAVAAGARPRARPHPRRPRSRDHRHPLPLAPARSRKVLRRRGARAGRRGARLATSRPSPLLGAAQLLPLPCPSLPLAQLSKVCGEPNPYEILAKSVKTDVLPRHIRRLNMITSGDDVFAIAPVFVVPMEREPARLDDVLHSPACIACSVVSSVSSSRHVAFGKPSVLAERNLCGTMGSTSLSYQRTPADAFGARPWSSWTASRRFPPARTRI